MRDGGDFTVFDESAGRRALLRVPRPLRGLLLYLRKAHHPTDSSRLWVGWQGKCRASLVRNGGAGKGTALSKGTAREALRCGDWVMRPGFGGKGARRQSLAYRCLCFARVLLPKPHAHGPVAVPGLK